jgi:myosin heavy subunit
MALAFPGCAVLDFFRDTSKDETEKPMTQEEMQKEIKKLSMENTELLNEIEDLRNRYLEMDQQLIKLQRNYQEVNQQNKILEERVAELQTIDQILKFQHKYQRESEEDDIIEEKPASQPPGDQMPSSQTMSSDKDQWKIKVKVLSGDGDINSAQKIAKRLKGMGYKIENVDYAPRANFKKNIVYFSPNYEEEGKRLVQRLGSNTILKALSWPSSFHLIVVTGKNR